MSCKIHMDGTTALVPGGCVTGTIVCGIPSDRVIREIRCVLKGRERVSFKQGKTTYTGSNEFILQKLVLRGEGNIPAGSYEYPFSFNLPLELPMSFETDSGNIGYSLKATVDIPFDFDYEEKIGLIVEYPVDLNVQPGVLLGDISYEWEETSTCFCCNAGSAIMKVVLYGRNAYLPGENIKVFVDVQNLTSNNIEALQVSLARVTTCKSDGATESKNKDVITTRSFEGVGANGNRTYSFDFPIPPTIPKIYSFPSCKLISQVFRLRVEGQFPLLYENIIVDVNLILGHIPLRNFGMDGGRIPLNELSEHDDIPGLLALLDRGNMRI